MTQTSSWLRRVLAADGVISGATGVMLIVGAGALQGPLGMPESFLRWAGLSLLPFAALVLHLSRAAVVSAAAVRGVIVANVAWVAASVALVFSGWLALTLLGYAFVIGQAVAVGALAELQYVGLRRSAAA